MGFGIAVSVAIGRALGQEPKLAVLVAMGNSICGNSAIAAVAPVIRAEKRQVASAIGLTAVIGVCLVLGLPLLIGPFALTHYEYGVLAGMSVYAVPRLVHAADPRGTSRGVRPGPIGAVSLASPTIVPPDGPTPPL